MARKPLVLIADDDPQVLKVLRLCLMSEFQVIAARDGFQAVELVFSRRFDCILMDIKMPRLNGWEAVQLIRDRGVDVPIIVMTGYSEMLDDSKIRHLGIDASMAKPFELRELMARIRHLTGVNSNSEKQGDPPV